jgi:hypothetical protein
MDSEPERRELDGMVVVDLPEDIGTQTADFDYEWDGVSFVQRVWESEMDGGGWRPDLQVMVLRGEQLRDLDALRMFMAEYHEKDEDWILEPFEHGPWHGYASDREVFWLVEPGWAAEVRDPFGNLDPGELGRIARGGTPLAE